MGKSTSGGSWAPTGDWQATPLSSGQTLGDLAAKHRVLLVFLRHTG